MESLRGRLLIANGGLFDPNFRRAVVLVGEHGGEGALGVVLNRPSPVLVQDAVPALGDLPPTGEPVFVGGPVQPTSAVVLAEFEDPGDAGLLVMGSIGFLLGEVDPGIAERVRRTRVFAGYAGWGPGQLEEELAEDAWIVEPALSTDVFTDHPEALWRTVLSRKGGQFALLATMPDDPSLN